MTIAMTLAASRAKPMSTLGHIMTNHYSATTVIYLTLAIGFCLLVARTRRGGAGGITHGVVAAALHGVHAAGSMAHGAVVGGIPGEGGGAGGMLDRASGRRNPSGQSVGFLVRAIHGLGEVGAIGLALLVVAHEPLWVGVPLALIYSVPIAASVHAAVSGGGPNGVFVSAWQDALAHPRNASIAAAALLILSFGSPAIGVLLAGVAAAIVVGFSSRSTLRREMAVRAGLAESVAGALGIGVDALERLAWYVGTDGTVTVERPAAALLNLDRLGGRVAVLLPHLEVAEANANRIVLSAISEEAEISRAHAERSGGMVTGTTAHSSVPEWSPAPAADSAVSEYTITKEDLL